MKKYEMDKIIRKYCKRFIKENYSAELNEINKRAEIIYQKLCNEAPDIGLGENLMASNLYQFLTFIAYYEASDKRITKEDIKIVVSWMIKDFEPIGKIVNMNSPICCKVFYTVVRPYVAKLKKKKAKGKWGNTWDMLINPENHKTGFSIHLIGCPLCDFARSHGYEDILPMMCQIDHDIAALMHARLIRKHTIAAGSNVCDYWYVGDKTCEELC